MYLLTKPSPGVQLLVCLLAFAQRIHNIASKGIISRSNPPNKWKPLNFRSDGPICESFIQNQYLQLTYTNQPTVLEIVQPPRAAQYLIILILESSSMSALDISHCNSNPLLLLIAKLIMINSLFFSWIILSVLEEINITPLSAVFFSLNNPSLLNPSLKAYF